jgi:hypothetical protein
MTAMTPAPGESAYEMTSDYVWTEKAYQSLQEGRDMHGEVISRDGVLVSRVWGQCPRCQHLLDDRQTLTALPGLIGVRGGDQVEAEQDESHPAWRYTRVDVSCGCGDAHQGAPGGRTGCGASFRVELPVQENNRPDNGG